MSRLRSLSFTFMEVSFISTDVFFQVRFALSSALVFTRSDTAFDSVRFYNSLMAFLEDPDEEEEVNELLVFWNQ
jgi:hypothetical protein